MKDAEGNIAQKEFYYKSYVQCSAQDDDGGWVGACPLCGTNVTVTQTKNKKDSYLGISCTPETREHECTIPNCCTNKELECSDYGEIRKVNASEKLKIDGVKYNSGFDAFSALGGSGTEGQLISYEKDANGDIKKIDTVAKNKEIRENKESLYERFEEKQETYRNVGKLGRKMYLDAQTVIFGVPSDIQNAEEFDFVVKGKSDLSADTAYTVTSYAFSDNVDYEEVLVIKDAEWYQTSNNAGILVQAVSSKLNENEDVVECIVGYQGLQKVELLCVSGYSAISDGVKNGDYITYTSDKNNHIRKVDIKYSVGMSDDKRPKETNLYQKIAITSGYVNSVNNMIVSVGTESGEDFDEAYNFETAPVLIYDIKTNKIYNGSINDLISYETSGNNCSFVLAHMRYSSPKVFVIYR